MPSKPDITERPQIGGLFAENGRNPNASSLEPARHGASLADSLPDGPVHSPTDCPPPTTAENSSEPIELESGDRPSWLTPWKRFIEARRTPALLVSIIVHTSILLLLALWTLADRGGPGNTFDFQVTNTLNPVESEPVKMLVSLGEQPAPPSSSATDAIEDPRDTSRSASISELLTLQGPKEAQIDSGGALAELLEATSIRLNASFASTGVEGRQLEKRRDVALANGGTLKSEQAVENALVWLAEHQRPNGSWSLVHSSGNCNGRCSHDGSKDRFDTAATGLSLLAFLGAGYTHREGKHRETVRRGIYFLLQVVEETSEGGSFLYQSDRGMYNHGIATFALCEAYQLTGDKDLRPTAQRAVDFIASAQNYRGGWGYLPKQPGDLTISGWQIMALKSAFAAGLDVPASNILRIDPFLDSQQSQGGVFYGYRKPGESPTCTAIALLVRLFRGMTHSDPRILEGAEYFQKSGPTLTDAYSNYYSTLFLFHVGGPFWKDWNPKMREHLIQTQSQYGHEAGSWYFDNPYGQEGGRLYTTAMCAMTLEVYYRFAPLYQQVDLSFEL